MLSALLGMIWGFTMHVIALAHHPADAIRQVSYGVYEEELARLEGHRRIWRRVVAGMCAARRVGSVKESGASCVWPALTPPPPTVGVLKTRRSASRNCTAHESIKRAMAHLYHGSRLLNSTLTCLESINAYLLCASSSAA